MDHADLRPGDQHDLRVHRHAQRLHPDPVAGDRRRSTRPPWPVREFLAAAVRGGGRSTPTGARRPRSPPTRPATSCCRSPTRTASSTPSTATTWPPGRSGSTRSPSAATARTCGDGTHRLRHLRQRHRSTTPAAATCINGHGSGGSITAFDPGTGNVLWTRQTEQPDPGLARLRQRHDRLGRGLHLRGAQRRQRRAPLLLRAAGPVYGAVSVADGASSTWATQRRPLRLRPAGSTTTPPRRPELPVRVHLPGHPQPGVAGSETHQRRRAHGDRVGRRDPRDRPTSSGSSPSRSPATPSPASRSFRRAPRTRQPQAGLMVRQSTDPTSPFYAVLAYPNDLTEGNPLPTRRLVPVGVRRARRRADQALPGHQAGLP